MPANEGTSTGNVDVPIEKLDFRGFKAKIRFSWNGGSPCLTGAFDLPLTTDEWSISGAGACATGYDETTGEFCVVASGFTVPTLASTACQSHGTAINSAFSLGTSTGTHAQILLGQTTPTIEQ